MVPRPRTPERAGFTLTELTIALFLLASMVMMAGLATDRGMGALRQHRSEQQAIVVVQRTLQRIARELEFAGLGGMTPRNPLGEDHVSYRICNGYDAGTSAAVWGGERTLRLEYDPGDGDDDIDNDGDGLIDEGILVLVENVGGADEQRIVLATGVAEYLQGEELNGDDDNGNGLVDERGLTLTFVDALATVRLSLQASGANGVITKTLETTVSVHN